MANIKVELLTQLKAAAGQPGLTRDCADVTLSQVSSVVAEALPETGPLMLSESGGRHAWLLASVDDIVVAVQDDPVVPAGATVLLGTPISGG